MTLRNRGGGPVLPAIAVAEADVQLDRKPAYCITNATTGRVSSRQCRPQNGNTSNYSGQSALLRS